MNIEGQPDFTCYKTNCDRIKSSYMVFEKQCSLSKQVQMNLLDLNYEPMHSADLNYDQMIEAVEKNGHLGIIRFGTLIRTLYFENMFSVVDQPKDWLNSQMKCTNGLKVVDYMQLGLSQIAQVYYELLTMFNDLKKDVDKNLKFA